MTEFLNIMDNLKVVLSELNLKNEFGSLANKIDELTKTNTNLSKKMGIHENVIKAIIQHELEQKTIKQK